MLELSMICIIFKITQSKKYTFISNIKLNELFLKSEIIPYFVRKLELRNALT